MRRGSIIALFLVLSSASLIAQERDSLMSGYSNDNGFGGPKTVGAQLEFDNTNKEPYYRVPIKVFGGWYDLKTRIQKKTGIEFGLNYTSVVIGSSDVIDAEVNSKTTGSGVLDIQLGWTAIGRKSKKNQGKIFAKLNSRHVYGDRTSPMFHGIGESGYYGLPAVGFRDYTFRITELNWQQSLANNHVHFVAGKVDPTNYFNFHGLIVPWQHFLGYGASVSGSVNWPDQGLGLIASVNTGKFYLMGGFTDVRGDIFVDGEFLNFGRNFSDGNFFKAVEVGYTPSFEERYFRKVSITYWHTDAYENPEGAAIPSGEGVAISAHWYFLDTYIPFLRMGFSNGNGENAFYKRDIQIGHGYRFKSHDILGIALSFAEPNIPDTKDQTTLEIFYRMDITQHFAVTPDVQLIFNPTLNPEKSSLFYWGLRGRLTF